MNEKWRRRRRRRSRQWQQAANPMTCCNLVIHASVWKPNVSSPDICRFIQVAVGDELSSTTPNCTNISSITCQPAGLDLAQAQAERYHFDSNTQVWRNYLRQISSRRSSLIQVVGLQRSTFAYVFYLGIRFFMRVYIFYQLQQQQQQQQ